MKELKSLQELTDTIKKLYTSYDDINLLIEMGYEENWSRRSGSSKRSLRLSGSGRFCPENMIPAMRS